jgi:Smr domain
MNPWAGGPSSWPVGSAAGARRYSSFVEHPDSPAGCLDSVRATAGGAALSGPVRLEAGDLTVALVLDGLPVGELPEGARLRIGGDVIVELGLASPDAAATDADRGILEGEETRPRPARVLEGGLVRPGDAVSLETVTIPLTDVLDLHSFRPEDVTAVVSEYLEAARRAGLAEVRIVHGRGRGVQRAVVRRLLADAPGVVEFADAAPTRGGWGATLVLLRKADDPPTG